MKKKLLLSVLTTAFVATLTLGFLTLPKIETMATTIQSATHVNTDSATISSWEGKYGEDGHLIFNGVSGSNVVVYSDMYADANKTGTEAIAMTSRASTETIDESAPISAWSFDAQTYASETSSHKDKQLFLPDSSTTRTTSRMYTNSYPNGEVMYSFTVDVDTPVYFSAYVFDWNSKADENNPIIANIYMGKGNRFNSLADYKQHVLKDTENTTATIDEALTHYFGAPLASTEITSVGGKYVTFKIEGAGDYRLSLFTRVSDKSIMPNLNGVFFDYSDPNPENTISFVGSDTTTENWQGTYGKSGYFFYNTNTTAYTRGLFNNADSTAYIGELTFTALGGSKNDIASLLSDSTNYQADTTLLKSFSTAINVINATGGPYVGSPYKPNSITDKVVARPGSANSTQSAVLAFELTESAFAKSDYVDITWLHYQGMGNYSAEGYEYSIYNGMTVSVEGNNKYSSLTPYFTTTVTSNTKYHYATFRFTKPGQYTIVEMVSDNNTTNDARTDFCGFFIDLEPVYSSISYNLDGGVNALTNPTTYLEGVESETLADPTKEGYTFEGWYTERTFKNKIDKISMTQTGDITLYAKFVQDVTSDVTTGSDWEGTYGKEGYLIFNGANNIYSDMYTMTDAGNAIAGEWKGNTYTPTDTSSTLSTAAPISAWGVAADTKNTSTNNGNRALYAPGTTTNASTRIATHNYGPNDVYFYFTLTENTPIYITVYFYEWNNNISDEKPMTAALYAGNNYHINSYGDGKVASKAGENATIEECVNYYQGGEPLAKTNVTNTQNYVTFKIREAGKYCIVLYSATEVENWKQNTPNANLNGIFFDKEPVLGAIDYELDGGVNAESNPDVYAEGVGATLADPTKEDCDFLGWYTDVDFTNQVTEISATQTGDITLYAKFTQVIFNVYYELDGGVNADGNPDTYRVGEGVTLADPTKEACDFLGWYTDADFTNQVTEISATQTGDITLYAKFTQVIFNVYYELDGGVNADGNPDTYRVGEGVTLADPTKEGYTFAGWYIDAEYSNKITEISTTQTGDMTLYAKFWEIVTNSTVQSDWEGTYGKEGYLIFNGESNIYSDMYTVVGTDNAIAGKLVNANSVRTFTPTDTSSTLKSTAPISYWAVHSQLYATHSSGGEKSLYAPGTVSYAYTRTNSPNYEGNDSYFRFTVAENTSMPIYFTAYIYDWNGKVEETPITASLYEGHKSTLNAYSTYKTNNADATVTKAVTYYCGAEPIATINVTTDQTYVTYKIERAGDYTLALFSPTMPATSTGANATLNGVFFDYDEPIYQTPTQNVTHVSTNTTYGADWEGRYGKDGYIVLGNNGIYSDMYTDNGVTATTLHTNGTLSSGIYKYDGKVAGLNASAPINNWGSVGNLTGSDNVLTDYKLYIPGTETHAASRFHDTWTNKDMSLWFDYDGIDEIYFTVNVLDWAQKVSSTNPITVRVYALDSYGASSGYATTRSVVSGTALDAHYGNGNEPVATATVTAQASYVTFKLSSKGRYQISFYGENCNPMVNGFFFDKTNTVDSVTISNSHSITLGEQVGANFYVDENPMWFTMDFVWGDNHYTATSANKDAKGRYYFTCPVAPKDIDKTITATLKNGDVVVDTNSYTVVDYAKALASTGTAEQKQFANALLNYGAYAKTYFYKTPLNLYGASDLLAEWGDMQLTASASVSGTKPDALTKNFASTLILDSTMAVRFYFAGDVTVMYNGIQLEKKAVDSSWTVAERGYTHYVEIELNPTQLDEDITINVGSYRVTYSAMVYAKNVLEKTEDIALKNLIKALYFYNQAAKNIA